jgi:hypothetical protein
VQHLVGRSRLDDHAIAEIVRTGASETELIEALNRVVRGSEVGAESLKPMTLVVARLCDILATAADPFADQD